MTDSPLVSPRHCRVSQKFLYAPSKDLGAWISWQIRRRKHRQIRWGFRIRLFGFLLASATYALSFYIPETHEFLNPTAIILFSLFSLYWIFSLFYFGIRSQSASWRRIFNADTWAGLIALLAAHAIFCPQDFSQVEIPASPLHLMWLCLALYSWVLLRWAETEFFRHQLSSHFKNSDLEWYDAHAIHRSIASLDIFILISGILILAPFYIFQGHPLPYLIALSALPLVLPYSQWLMTWTLKRADQHRLACSEFSFFRNLRKFKLFIFHQFGALTEGNIKIDEYIIDSHDEWSKDEIKDILFRITEESSHPIAKLIHEKFKSNKRSLVTLQKVEAKPHLGIQAEFKDLQGRSTAGVLGGMTWHKVLQHEIFPETLVKLREWKEKKNKVILLSLNRKILAMFALSDPVRENWEAEIQNFKTSGLFPVLMTSNEDFYEIPEANDSFLERAVNLVPVERVEQKRYWLERETRAIEVVSYWDEMDEPRLPQILFTPDRSLVSNQRSAFVAPRLDDLRQMVRVSKAHHLWRYIIGTSSLILTAIAASLLS